MSDHRAARAVRDVALTVGAVLGALFLVGGIAAWAFDVRPLIVQSGSMSPEIRTGALAFAHDVPATQVEVGDVVVVRASTGSRVTHRVVDASSDGGEVRLRLKGDANEAPDAETYTVSRVGRVIGDVPLLGYALAAMASPIGLLVLGACAAVLIGLVIRGGEGRDRRGRRRAVAGAALVLLAAPAAMLRPQPTQAAWTDDVAVSGPAFTASSVPAPVLRCGALGVLSVTFAWDAVPGATGYTLFYNNGASSVSLAANQTSRTISGAVNLSSTAWLVAHRNFGSTTWTSARSNTRSYTFLLLSFCG